MKQPTRSLKKHITISGKALTQSSQPRQFIYGISSTTFSFQKLLRCLLQRITKLAKLRRMEHGLEVKTMDMHSMAMLTMVPLTTSTSKISRVRYLLMFLSKFFLINFAHFSSLGWALEVVNSHLELEGRILCDIHQNLSTILRCCINMRFDCFSILECDPWTRTTNSCNDNRCCDGKTRAKSRRQNKETWKIGKGAWEGHKYRGNTEVMQLFDSFVTHAKDLYTKACTPVKLQWKRCVTSTVVVLECLVHVTVL